MRKVTVTLDDLINDGSVMDFVEITNLPLKLKDTGEGIGSLQNKLKELGYYPYVVEVDKRNLEPKQRCL